MSADMKQVLIGYLASGATQADAALAAGVTEGYVSQLMNDADFAAAVASKRATRSARYAAMDDTADSAQETALNRLSKVIAVENRANVLLQAISVLDKMQRRSAPTNAQQGSTAGLVKIVLPAAAAARYTISVDSTNRVVQVDTHTMVPASAKLIDQLAEQEGGSSHGRSREAGVLPIAASEPAAGEGTGALPPPAIESPSTTYSAAIATRSPGRTARLSLRDIL